MSKLSIIVPVFNEEATFPELLRRVAAAALPRGWEKELIIVNDGSTDGTGRIAERFSAASHPGLEVRHLSQPGNRGKGACVRLGITAATGDAVIIQDADLEYDPADYTGMIEGLVNQNADVVYGSRFLARKPVTTRGHRLLNWALTALARLATGFPLTDVYTCLKLFRAEVIKSLELREERFGICIEITSRLARKVGLKLIEVPVRYQPRTRQQGKKIGMGDGFRALYCLATYAPWMRVAAPLSSAAASPARARDWSSGGRSSASARFSLPATTARSGRGWLWAALAASLALRLSLLDFQGFDYQFFLSRWYDFFVDHGRWQGLGQVTVEFADYPPLYLQLLSLATLLPIPKLYAIKLLSVACDYLAAWYVWRLAKAAGATHGPCAWAPVVFLCLPTVVLNSAVWGQCDVMYATGFLASLLYVLQGRPLAALAAFGISCSLKPQAIFWCPFLAALMANGRLSWKWLWVPPSVYALCGLPSVLAGQPVLHVLGHWARVRNLPGLTLGAPNWYQWMSAQESRLLWGAGVLLALGAAIVFVLWVKAGPREGQSLPHWLVRAALMSVVFPPFLLPGMHDRYFFPADVLALVYALSAPRGWVVVVLMQLASGLAYCPFLFGCGFVPGPVLALVVAGAIEWVLLNGFSRVGSARGWIPGLRAGPVGGIS
jgi:Gpi18-like mannosyltransferase